MIGIGQLVPVIPTAAQLNAQVAPLVVSQNAAAGMQPVLTSSNLAQPIPDITTVPVLAAGSCTWWEELNGEIRDHPYIAVGILFVTFAAVYGGAHAVKKRRARRRAKK